MLYKVIVSIREDGVVSTAKKILFYPIARIKKAERKKRRLRFEREALSLESVEERFTWIYENNKWGEAESVSGPGSTISHTKSLRRNLPHLVKRYRIRSMLDAPCGDFNWMKCVLAKLNVNYIGGDIVNSLIARNRKEFASEKVRFIKIDIINDELPSADLMICRDCLFHFCHADIVRFLHNFISSHITYLLTTSYVLQLGEENKDILTGEFRVLDLRAEPYGFPEPIEFIDDYLAPGRERYMMLWSRDQISEIFGCLPRCDTS